MAHARIVEYLLNAAPDSATDTDFTGKTPLHWAASAKNNPRSYNLLVQAGCDEQALDYVRKSLSVSCNKSTKSSDILCLENENTSLLQSQTE